MAKHNGLERGLGRLGSLRRLGALNGEALEQLCVSQRADPALIEERVDLPQDNPRLPCRHSYTWLRVRLLARHYLFCARTRPRNFQIWEILIVSRSC